MPRRKPLIRQNPVTAEPAPPTELCPEHGPYPRPAQAVELQREAQTEGVDPAKARAMLERSVQIRQRCPHCEQRAPTLLEWATRVRQRAHPAPQPASVTLTTTRARFTMPPRDLVDPGMNEVRQ